MIKLLINLSILLYFLAKPVVASTILNNSYWLKAANYAGINVTTFYSIAAHESGMRWNDGTFRPYPWTLNVNKGQGVRAGSRRYANQQAAATALQAFINSGIRNIDVGLMQVNLHFHNNKVSNALSLLDPYTNLSVAAQILKEVNTGDITTTVAHYHSRNHALGSHYVISVKKFEKIINAKLK